MQRSNGLGRGEMNEWIKVEDKRPEEGLTFLTWDGHYIRTAEILYIEEDGNIEWLDGGNVFSKVSHWMPIPDPPADK